MLATWTNVELNSLTEHERLAMEHEWLERSEAAADQTIEARTSSYGNLQAPQTDTCAQTRNT